MDLNKQLIKLSYLEKSTVNDTFQKTVNAGISARQKKQKNKLS